jgi:hypothetical protein
MSKTFAVLIILSLLLSIASPALAAQRGPDGHGYDDNPPRYQGTAYALNGKITALDPVARTVTVKVQVGNRLAKPYIGQEVVLTTTPATRLLRNIGDTAIVIAFDDLQVGQFISSNGVLADDTWTAKRITVK